MKTSSGAVIGKSIDAAEADELQLIFEKMAAKHYAYDDTERDRKASKFFDEVVSQAAEILSLSLKQWEQQKAIVFR